MDKLRWYQIILFWIGVIGIFVAPLLLTRPYPFEWDFFDFSQSGQVGDTIGGITAPIVGLVSILLLWWTLREQVKFNRQQMSINDASRILTMQSQIIQMDDNIRYAYSTADRVHEGKGCASLRVLMKGTPSNVRIPYDTLKALIERVHILDVSVSSLVNVTKSSSLSKSEKKSTCSIAMVYVTELLQFYKLIANEEIEYLLPINEAGNELINQSSAKAYLENIARLYLESLTSLKSICEDIINN